MELENRKNEVLELFALVQNWENEPQKENLKSGVPEGSRNVTAASQAGTLFAQGKSKKIVTEKMRAWNEKNQPPMESDELLKTIDSIYKTEQKSKKTKKPKAKKSQSDILLEIAEKYELFHTSDQVTYACVNVANHRETHSVRSKEFKTNLSMKFYQQSGRAPGRAALNDCLNVIEGQALFNSKQKGVFTRIGKDSVTGFVYLDLCNANWQAVEISPAGWSIVNEVPIRFRRSRGALELPNPTPGGDISKLSEVCNINEKSMPLIKGFLIGSCKPDGPYPLLAGTGRQGTAKTSTMETLKSVVDPSIGGMRSAPQSERDLAVASSTNWIMAFDNLSVLPEWLSNALCRISTGGGFATRELYSDDEEKIFQFIRPVILNSINSVVKRHDLADRMIALHLDPIQKQDRRPKEELDQKFNELHPSILGGVMDAVVHALRDYQTIQMEELPRMADFCRWVCASENGDGDKFLNAYLENQRKTIENAVINDPVGGAVYRFARSFEASKVPEWEGPASQLMKDLVRFRDPEDILPTGANALSRRINANSGFLAELGVHIAFKRSSEAKKIVIGWKPPGARR